MTNKIIMKILFFTFLVTLAKKHQNEPYLSGYF